MWCDKMIGFSLRFGRHSSQYSRASTFTFRWSMPSWQMSACTVPVSCQQAWQQTQDGGLAAHT